MERSQSLEFTKVQFTLEINEDFGFEESTTRNIRNMKELRDALNTVDFDNEEFGLYLTGTTEDGHVAHFRFHSHPKKDHAWHWGYLSFALDKINSQAERLLKKIKDLLN